MGWLRCRLSFCLLRCAVMCFRGSRSRCTTACLMRVSSKFYVLWSSSYTVCKVKKNSLCLSLPLQEIVQRPTRVTEKSAKCIDLILTNTSYLMNPTVMHVDFTDHCLVASSLQCVDGEFPASNIRIYCRRRWPTNISDSRLSDALQKQMNLFGTMNGLDNMWSDWKDKFTKALDEVAPKVTTVHRRRQRCP